MRASLYEALGIPPTASDEEVRAALRRLIRKYYAKTRDGQGNVEEALRFINHASRILSDPDRRVRYNGELARSGDSVPAEIQQAVLSALVATNEGTDVAHPVADSGVERIAAADIAEPAADPARNVHHPGLTEPVASFGRPGIVTFALCALFGGFIAGAIILVMPIDTLAVAKQVLVWITVTLLALTLVYGIVHSFAWARRRGAPPVQVLMPQTDIAILNWRREKSVFLGTNQPQEDASWIFQLRMAELERAKTGRTSEPRPWNRLGARMFDYAFWGIVLALLLSELRRAGIVPETVNYWLSHPLMAPVIITGTWVGVETLLMASVGTTPGKWLFGCYVQYSISDAYARREMKSQIWRSFKRAFRVWWEGLGCGFPLIAPILIAIAYERLAQNHESDWDFAQDCLTTHAPAGALNTATGLCGLAAMLWLYGVAWHKPLADTIGKVGSSIVASMPSMQTMIPKGLSDSADVITGVAGGIRSPEAGTTAIPPETSSAPPLDSDVAAIFADRRAKVAAYKADGVRSLRSGNYRRAVDQCRAWTDLELSNAEAWRCLGEGLQGLGNHQEALNALRKAKQYDPVDRTIDLAIERSQKGIVGDFLNRYRK